VICVKVKAKIKIVIFSLYAISVISAMSWGAPFLIVGSTVTMFGLLTWLSGSGDAEGPGGKKRVVADFYSFIPGFGHLYLGKLKRSVPFLLVLMVSLLSVYLAMLYPSDAEYVFFVMSLLTLMYGIILSGIDVETLYDEMEFSDKNQTGKTRVTKFYGCYTLTFFASVIAVLLTVYYWFFDWNPDRNIWFYGITGTIWFIALCISLFGIKQWFSIRKNNT
jgi:hypothetical protein